jgi:hypothetical protein
LVTDVCESFNRWARQQQQQREQQQPPAASPQVRESFVPVSTDAILAPVRRLQAFMADCGGEECAHPDDFGGGGGSGGAGAQVGTSG